MRKHKRDIQSIRRSASGTRNEIVTKSSSVDEKENGGKDYADYVV